MSDAGYPGVQQLPSATSERNAFDFMARMLMGQMGTATLVRVEACSNDGGVTPVGTVDVLPLVNQINGAGDATPHGTIYGLPYQRVQGGTNAIIIDPQVGDIGLAVFASRDISSVKVNKAPSNPGSRRQFDMADGLYLGGMLNGTPEQYVRFYDGGVEVVTPGDLKATVGGDMTATVTGDVLATCANGKLEATTKLTLKAPDIQFEGPTHTTGTVTGDSTAVFTGAVTGAGIGLSTHKHIGVTTGGGTSGTPVP